jgi:hypothetical protein
MNKNIKQYAMVIMAIGVLLIIAGCYQAYNPVLAVSAHDDSKDVQRMLAITTFKVEPSYTSCDQLSMSLLMSYDNEPQNGFIDAEELVNAVINHGNGLITTDQLDQLECAWKNLCPVDIPPDPARIDDATDTLTTDKSTYRAGDVVRMTATGTNIGDDNWHGYIMFYSTDPNGYTKEVYEYELDVAAGATESRDGVMTLPASAVTGTWSIQSKWIDESGTVHAMTTIDLGTEEIFGIPTMAILITLIGIMLLIAGFSRKKE